MIGAQESHPPRDAPVHEDELWALGISACIVHRTGTHDARANYKTKLETLKCRGDGGTAQRERVNKAGVAVARVSILRHPFPTRTLRSQCTVR